MKKSFIITVALLATTALFGCGGDYNGPKLGGATTVDTTPPFVLSTSPTNSATNVSVTQTISASFSEQINAASVVAGSTFTLTPAVAGTSISWFGPATAVLSYTGSLAPGTTYTATVTTGVTDLAGNPLIINRTWTFTTSVAADTTPPTVVLPTFPATGATNVSINTKIAALFSETLLASTVTASTFRVTTGGAPVAASSVVCSGATATFTPTPALSSGTTYSVTLTTGITDLAGNALGNTVWTFTTAPTPSITTTSLPISTQTGSYSYTLQSSGGYGTLAWSAIGVPSGLSLSTAGVLSSSNITAAIGIYNIDFTLTDADGLVATKTLPLTITSGPIVSTTTLLDSTTTGTYDKALSATGGSGSYTWALLSGTLPTGLSLYTSGSLSSTPTISASAGTYSFTVEATDTSNNAKATQSLNLIVNAVPSVTTVSLPVAEVGVLYSSLTLSASNGTTPYGSWSANGLPSGLNFNTSNGTIFGTPTGPAGTSSVGFTVTDANFVTSPTTTLSLTVNDIPTITSPINGAAFSVTENDAFTLPMVASGGTGTLTWNVTGLPSVLSWSPSTGLSSSISGTVAAGAAGASGSTDYPVGLTVTDANLVSSATTTITVTALARVTGVTATANVVPGGGIDVSWTTLTNASSYTIYYSSSSPVTTAASSVTGVLTSPKTVTGLTTGTPYYFAISAVYPAGSSTLSSEASATAP